jgi:hypothetical protein
MSERTPGALYIVLWFLFKGVWVLLFECTYAFGIWSRCFLFGHKPGKAIVGFYRSHECKDCGKVCIK